MKLKKENIYINLQGKSEEELTELYNFLESVGEKLIRNNIEYFKKYSNLEGNLAHLSYRCDYDDWGNSNTHNKQEVTIEQLKEILQPTETLQEKEQRLLKELEEVRKEIEDSKIKVGDWVMNKEGVVMKVKSLPLIMPWEKITNPQLIELLEQEMI